MITDPNEVFEKVKSGSLIMVGRTIGKYECGEVESVLLIKENKQGDEVEDIDRSVWLDIENFLCAVRGDGHCVTYYTFDWKMIEELSFE